MIAALCMKGVYCAIQVYQMDRPRDELRGHGGLRHRSCHTNVSERPHDVAVLLRCESRDRKKSDADHPGTKNSMSLPIDENVCLCTR